jgi:hypothetical protein
MPPTKQEILEKYRKVISNEDFDVLISDQFPSPKALHEEGIHLQYLGTIGKWWIFAKHSLFGRVIGVICAIGAIGQGIEYTCKYGQMAYETVAKYVEAGQANKSTPATDYVFTDSPIDWPFPSEKPFRLVATTTTTTTTTTQPTTNPGLTTTIAPGSGIAPSSPSWRGYS